MSQSGSEWKLEYSDDNLRARFDFEEHRNGQTMVLFNDKTYSWNFDESARRILRKLLPKYAELFGKPTIPNDEIPLEVRTDPCVVGFFLLMKDKSNVYDDDDNDNDDAVDDAVDVDVAKFSVDDSIKCAGIDPKYKDYIHIKHYFDDYRDHEKVTIDWKRCAEDAAAKLENATAEIALLRAEMDLLRAENTRLGSNSTSTTE